MADLSITSADVAPVSGPGSGFHEQVTGPAAETVTAGQYVRLNVTSGTIELGKATSAAEARQGGICILGAGANETTTFVRKGYLDVGNALSALTYDDDVYLSNTDGTLADAAGSVSLIVGTVVPSWGHTTADKLLRVDL